MKITQREINGIVILDTPAYAGGGLKGTLRDTVPAVVTSPPYADVLVELITGAKVTVANLSFIAHALVNPQKGETYRLQVY